MLTMIVAAALGAAAPASQAALPAGAQQMQMGQMPGMDMSKMDHSKMDHSKMSGGSDCCKKGADGKMECSMPKEAGAASGQQGHSGQ